MIVVVLALALGCLVSTFFAVGAFMLSARADDTAEQIARQLADGENPFFSSFHNKDIGR
ncbi:hypothetical protein SH584_11360 [Sphingomonas sp. LY29]|uniref:hypothetical protein n=1 Tax=Sphingomonas sp. LY29 TaxID=3095341 RepID=UPI002D79764C|nr:hypothetical protein [Sphingomonas sp. LY29]WRP25629.1 hypothetical protein SH584_11360 [Sphingomonas sp. LY29]